MLIRRGGVTDVPWILARLEIKCLISIQYFTRCNYGSVISQLRVLASHRSKFGVCSSRRLENRALGNGEVPFFFFLLACLAISSKKKCL